MNIHDFTPREHISIRDRIAWRLCNLILNTIATPWYRVWVQGAIAYGVRTAARDSLYEDKE